MLNPEQILFLRELKKMMERGNATVIQAKMSALAPGVDHFTSGLSLAIAGLEMILAGQD
jgi:hypothetical protein